MANSSSSKERNVSHSKIDDKLMRNLSSCSETVVFNTLLELRKQHRKEADAIEQFRKNGGVSLLIKLIEKPKFADMALSILANNCLHTLWRKEFIKQDGVTCLARILQGLAPDSIQNRACRALTNVALDKYGAKVVHEKKPLSLVVKFLISTDNPECQQTALRSLRILTDNIDHRRELCKLLGVLAIVKLLKSDVDDVVKSSVKALSWVTQKCSKECAEQVQEGEGPSSLISLSSGRTDEVQKHALTSLVNLSGQSFIKSELGKAGVIPLFVNHINSSQTKTSDLTLIIEALCLLCQESVNRLRVRETGGLQTLVNILNDSSYCHLHKCVMAGIQAFKYDDPSLELLLNLNLVQMLAKHLREYTETEKCKYVGLNSQEEKDTSENNLQMQASGTSSDDSKDHSKTVEHSTASICSPSSNEITKDSIQGASSVKSEDNENAQDEGFFPEYANEATLLNSCNTSKIFSINSPSYQEMQSYQFEVPYAQPSMLSPGREFPGSPQSFDSAYCSNMGNFSPSSNVSYMSSVFDDYLSAFSSEEEDDDDDSHHHTHETFQLQELNEGGFKETQNNSRTSSADIDAEYANKNIKKVIKSFSICTHGTNTNEEECVQSVLKDILDNKNFESFNSLFPYIQASDKSPKKFSLSKHKNCRCNTQLQLFGLASAKKRLWNDDICTVRKSHTCVDTCISSEKNKRKKHYRGSSLEDDWSALRVPDLPAFSRDQLTVSTPDDNETIKEMKTTTLGTFIINFFSHLSHIEELGSKLATEACLQSILKYFSEHPCPSPLSEKILLTLSNNLLCFEKFISVGFVGMILDNYEREHFSRICDRCRNLDKLKNQLFSNLRFVAESGFGTGVLLHFFHTGTQQEKANAMLAVPFIVKKMCVLHKLLVDVPGLEMLTNLVQKVDNEFYLHALHSLFTLCQTLIDHNNFWKIPEAELMYSGSKLKCMAISKKSDTSPEICKYKLHSDEFNVWFVLDDDTKIGANRLQLCENSIFFSAMLDGYFVESVQSELKLPGISTEAFLVILHYLHGCYQEPCTVLHTMSLELLLELIVACDMFLLNEFQEIILRKIINNLRPDSVQMIYIHSKKYGISELKVAVINYLLSGTMGKIMCLSILDELFHSECKSGILDDITDAIRTNLTVGLLSNFPFNTS